MKSWKLALLFVCIAAVALTLGTYSSGTTVDTQQRRIIYVYKTTLGNIDFWNSITDGIKAGARNYNISYDIIGALEEADIDGNIQALQKAVRMRPDAIVLSATDYKLLEPYAKEVVDAGILLLTVDSDVNGGWSRCFVGTDNYEAGRRMGEELQKRIPPHGKVGIIGHIASTDTAIQRIAGAVDGLGIIGGHRLVPPVYCDNRIVQAMQETIKLVEENPDLTGLIGTNELAALGIGMAIAQLGLQDEIAVISCDNSTQQMSYLEQGVIDATIVQKPFNMGYMSVELAVQLLQDPSNPDIPAFYDTGYEVITHDNMFTAENQKLLFPFRG